MESLPKVVKPAGTRRLGYVNLEVDDAPQRSVYSSDNLQCDRQTPSCGQCIRAGRPCVGYRSELDLMFRNESEAVAGKAKAREKSKAKAKPSTPRNAPLPAPEPAGVASFDGEAARSSMFRNDENRDLSTLR